MDGLFVSVTLVYTLLSCGLLLAGFFRFRGNADCYLKVGFCATCIHTGYKLLWLVFANGDWYELPIPLGLVYPVVLYLFARSYYQPDNAVSKRIAMLLFLPFVVNLVLFTVVSLQGGVVSSLQVMYSSIYYLMSMVSLAFFASLTAIAYGTYKGPSTPADILIRQLTMICFGLVILSALMLYRVSSPQTELGFEVRPMVFLFLAIGFALMLRYLLMHKRDAYYGNLKDERLSGAEQPVEEVPSQRLQEVMLRDLAEVIDRELHGSQLFLSPSVSLDVLAKRTGIPRHRLSQVFNAYYNTTFYQYIATARIEYAITRILAMDDDAVTLDTLSYQCGFNSKTSFNRYFKAHTGMTPSEFRAAAHSQVQYVHQ